ncbi:MAG TPA: hypothetical protein VFZ25_10785 [Chloroflexota bacterium]|nr:hypothetical protein [Chloroflexota bacterium]
MSYVRAIFAFLIAVASALVALPAPTSAADCQFVFGFKAIHDAMPAIVGNCIVNEHHNAFNGDALQETTGPGGAGGLLVWRKADNWTAFTDGYHTWVNGPVGIQARLNSQRFCWEGDAPQPCAQSGPVSINPNPAPTPAPPPAATISVPLAVAPFERGSMIWRGDSKVIYVLYADGTYAVYPDTFGPGDPESIGLIPPTGLLEPIRGFGKLWRNVPEVHDRLGWETVREVGVQGRIGEGNGMVTINAPGFGVFVIQSSGSWARVPGT